MKKRYVFYLVAIIVLSDIILALYVTERVQRRMNIPTSSNKCLGTYLNGSQTNSDTYTLTVYFSKSDKNKIENDEEEIPDRFLLYDKHRHVYSGKIKFLNGRCSLLNEKGKKVAEINEKKEIVLFSDSKFGVFYKILDTPGVNKNLVSEKILKKYKFR